MFPLNNDLMFLQKKIGEIKTAMFKADIDSVLQLPNNIVSTLRIDNDGHIWFFTSYNGRYAKEIDQSFHAQLNYHQKGSAYRLMVNGKASIVQDEAHVTETDSPVGFALIKFKITHAEYFESRALSTPSFKTRIKDLFTEIFFSDNHREFDFSEPAMR